jgi:hypothetical protein
MIDLDNGIQYLAKYGLSELVIMYEDTKMELDYSNLLRVDYQTDYENDMFAMIKITLRVDVRKRLYMLEHKRDIRVKLVLDTAGMDLENDDFVLPKKPVIDGIFSAYFNDDEEHQDTTLLKQRLQKNESGPNGNSDDIDELEDENYFETQNMMEMYLFNPDMLRASRFKCNEVYTRDILQNIVGELLTNSGHKKVLMSKIENDEVYKELLIPPVTAQEALMYIDQQYGMYRTGAIIFYDWDVLYIVNTNGKLTTYRQGEWKDTTFMIPDFNDNQPGDGMFLHDGEEIYYPMISDYQIEIFKTSIMGNVIDGADVKVIRVDSVEIESYDAEQEYIDKKNVSHVYAHTHNKYAGDIITRRMEENDAYVYISGNNFDIRAFTPNKRYKIVFADPEKNHKYRGNYRLAFASHTIKAQSENYMDSSHRIILRKSFCHSDVKL